MRDAEEALKLTNATPHGLAGSVFTRSKKRGMEIARQMKSGMTSINDIISLPAVPALPFGGVGDSGFGRIHGADGLREFTRAKAITRQRFPVRTPLATFRRDPKMMDNVAKVMGMVHGRS